MEQTRPHPPEQKPAGGADNADLFRRPPVGLRLLGYRFLLQPRARLMLSWGYRWRVHGKRALRGFRHSGMFLYGNRTGTPLDALVPACLTDKPILVPAPPRGRLSRHTHRSRGTASASRPPKATGSCVPFSKSSKSTPSHAAPSPSTRTKAPPMPPISIPSALTNPPLYSIPLSAGG